MNAVPRISVVIPVRDGAAYLSSAIGTVERQGRKDLEVLLIDDGSGDDLAVKVAACPGYVRYIRQEPAGQAAARNNGIAHAAGEYIAYLDIDDLWAPEHLNNLCGVLDNDSEAGIAQGMMRQFWKDAAGTVFGTPLYRMPYLGSCLFRREVFARCGNFDVTMAFGEDYDFLFRCWENDIVKVNVPQLSLLYRRHEGNMTRGHNVAAHTIVVKRRLERIRAGLCDPSAVRRFVFQDYIGDLGKGGELLFQEAAPCVLP